MAGDKIIILTESNFSAEVLESPLPVLVDFWAPWCGPCKLIAPLLEELAGEYEERAKFGKVNIDDEPNLANQFGIRAVPTLLILKSGEVVEQIVGPKSRRDWKSNLDKYV